MSGAKAYNTPEQEQAAKSAGAQNKKKGGILRSRFLAVVIAIIAICGATFASAQNGLEDLCWDVEGIYYSGSYNSDTNYYEPSIDDQLDVRLDSANGILSTLAGYEGASEQVADFREKTDALYRAWEPHAECYTNDQLQLSYEALKQAVEGLELSERDQKMFDAYSSDFNGAQNILSTSATDYNLAVRALNKKISSFPAAALVGLTGVSVPQLFE